MADVLARAERVLFYGPPDQALALLEQGRDARSTPVRLATRWLTGVALGSLGRYGQALAELEPMLAAVASGADAATPQERLFAGHAAATTASVLRQLGNHAGGQRLDRWGLWVLSGLDPSAGLCSAESTADSVGAYPIAYPGAYSVAEAAADCAIGLAADAVGLGDPEEAHRRVREAAYRVGRCGPQRWRVRVRLDWVLAEVALLAGRPAEAVAASQRALLASQRAGAPRHVVKSLLFLGVSQLEAARGGGAPAAVAALRRAATTAEALGLLPLVWPAHAVLGAALASAAGAQESLDTARATVRTIAADLPRALREAWLCRPDIEALAARPTG